MTINTRAFAEAVIDILFDMSSDPEETIEAIELAAEEHGLIISRKPTPSEIGDPDWWGHAEGIGPDDETIMDRTPEFAALTEMADA